MLKLRSSKLEVLHKEELLSHCPITSVQASTNTRVHKSETTVMISIVMETNN